MVLVFGMAVIACDNGTTGGNYVPPEDLPVTERWGKWVDPDSDVTLDYLVSGDDICTITVSGTPADQQWKASPRYHYTVKKNTNYTYVFEAWTETGERKIGIQYYEDNDDSVYIGKEISITSERKTYTIVGKPLPKGGEKFLAFQCADQLGTFYIKILSITEGGEYDYVKIRSVMPSTGLTEGGSEGQKFTVVVDYCLVSCEQAELNILFNGYFEDIDGYIDSNDLPNLYNWVVDGELSVNKGKGSHTFKVSVIPKNWYPEGEFSVMCVLGVLGDVVYEEYDDDGNVVRAEYYWTFLDDDIKALSFK